MFVVGWAEGYFVYPALNHFPYECHQTKGNHECCQPYPLFQSVSRRGLNMEHKEYAGSQALFKVDACVRGRICSQIGNTRFTWCVCQKHSAACQRNTASHRRTCHSNNTLRTYQVWSSSKCRERKRTAGIKRAGPRGNEADGRRCCLFLPVLNFDRLRLLLGSVSLLSHGQGRRVDSLGKGVRGVEEQWGGWSGGESWSCLRDINIFDSQMITLCHS